MHGPALLTQGLLAACHFLMLDDLGTKIPFDRLAGFELSWLIETSPGNYQGEIILADPVTDGAVAVRLLNAVIDAGLCDPGAGVFVSALLNDKAPEGAFVFAFRRSL